MTDIKTLQSAYLRAVTERDNAIFQLTQLKAERDKAVELAVKLIKIFSIPREDYAEYFRKLRIGAGVYMGTGYAVMDAFFRVYDDFVDNSDDNLYRAVKRGLEESE